MSRFEIKIALALLVTAGIPLIVALALASRLVDDSVTVGLNPKVQEAVQARAPLVRDFIRARLAYFKNTLRSLSRNHQLHMALQARDRGAVQRLLNAELQECQHCGSLRLFSPTLRVRASARTRFPAGQWAARSFPPDDEPGMSVPGHPDVRLRLGGVIERRYLGTLRESGQFARLYGLLRQRSGAIKRSYLLAFALALGVSIVAALALGIFLARRVTKRVGPLIEATRRVAAGDLDFQIPVKARDEISDLTQSFNQMLADLSDSQRRIVYLETIAAWQEIARRLAHEIKNPLTPILLAMQQVHNRYTGEDERFQKTIDAALEVVTEEVEALRTLVGEFTDFAKLPTVNLQTQDLVEFIEEVARGQAAKGAQVELDIAPGATSAPVALDRMLLKRALVNLIKNARESMQGAGVDGVPKLALRIDRARAILEVIDRGPGVHPQERARIFDPYYTTKHEGTGLGLAIVKKIILDHRGIIDVADNEGGGACFRIRLPLVSGEEKEKR